MKTSKKATSPFHSLYNTIIIGNFIASDGSVGSTGICDYDTADSQPFMAISGQWQGFWN